MLAAHWLMKCALQPKALVLCGTMINLVLCEGKGGGRPLTRLTFDPGAGAWTPHDKSQILLENIGAGVFSDALASLALMIVSVSNRNCRLAISHV